MGCILASKKFGTTKLVKSNMESYISQVNNKFKV